MLNLASRSPSRSSSLSILATLLLLVSGAAAQKMTTLETPRYRVIHEKKHAPVAAEILEIAEAVWPTLARAYDSYEHYQRIDILVLDESDNANGFAIYPWSEVAIFVPHMDWILRNRQIWLRNVVTHELAHVFTLRRAAHLAPFDYAQATGVTYSARENINWSFSVPWVPLIAPNWYVEGIAQFEAEQHGNDHWDSQRDMLVRDAWLTGTLPTLEYIETFDRNRDWAQGERVYNTGYAFLRYLKDRYGVEKVRALARPKPFFNFSSAVEKTFGKPLTELFEDWKRSLAERYADFKEIPVDVPAHPAIPGDYQQNLAFSPDGKYMAWLGNEENRRPVNWIFWREIGKAEVMRSDRPVTPSASETIREEKEPEPEPAPAPEPQPEPTPDGLSGAGARGFGSDGAALSGFSRLGRANGLRAARLQPVPRASRHLSPARLVQRNHHAVERSREAGSEGLEFNRDATRLLTSRQDYEYSAYTDLWEYEFRSKKPEAEKWRRLTWEERASYPSYHPTKDLIVFVRKKAGSTNLAILDSTGRIAQITNFSGGEQAFNPRFTPQGDSVYFTLQVEDEEAIAAVSASAPGFDPFLALQDSAAFPDSVTVARGQSVSLITDLRPGGIRGLHFSGDTLFFSSNRHDSAHSIYDVYARLPGDPAVYRATHVRGQALEPVVRDGTVYYQGFHRQKAMLSKVPLELRPTVFAFGAGGDTVPVAKGKKIDFSKHLETGEPYGLKVAQEIAPYILIEPQILESNRIYTDVNLGLQASIGGPYGSWSQTVGGEISKRLDLTDPLSYSLFYAGYVSSGSIRHTRRTWTPTLTYALSHDVIEVEDVQRIRDGARDAATGDTLSLVGRAVYDSRFTRNMVYAFTPLPYNFSLDGGFFRQAVTQDLAVGARIINHTQGTVEFPPEYNFTARYFRDAPQHKHYRTGLTWTYWDQMRGTYLPTGAGVFATVRKWWATYQEDFLSVDSLFVRLQADKGKPSSEFLFTQAQFDPWSVEAGTAGIWSPNRWLSLFANGELGAFLNEFPKETGAADFNGTEVTTSEETAYALWVLPYQLGGFFVMPGYPYNFRYRGRDIMEGTSMARGQVGAQASLLRGLFLPGSPLTSFRDFTVAAMANGGTTLISAPDRIYTDISKGRHHLLLDYGVRLALHFRIFHEFPFTIYAQGFRPYNHLKAENLFWYDYPHTGSADPATGLPSAEQIANAPRDREAYMELVKENRYFVGFNLGF